MFDILHAINSNSYSPFFLVFGLLFATRPVIVITFQIIPDLITDFTGPLALLLLPLYMVCASIVMFLGLIGGLIAGMFLIAQFVVIVDAIIVG